MLWIAAAIAASIAAGVKAGRDRVDQMVAVPILLVASVIV